MRKLLFLLLLPLTLFAQAGGNYVSVITTIPITSFVTGPGTTYTTMPDGTPALLAGYGSKFSKDLGISPLKLQGDPNKPGYVIDGLYTFNFIVLNYLWQSGYPGYYDIEIDFGTQELCSKDGFALDTVSQVTVTCQSPKYIVGAQALPSGGPVQGSQNLVIHGSTWITPGWQMYFGKFYLKFTPAN